jgi:hypothetical protein
MTTEPDTEAAPGSLDVAALLREAQEATGLGDLGGDELLVPLDQYVAGVRSTVRFKPGGLDVFRQAILRHLVNRLRIEEDLRRHPEILEEEVWDPIVIIGLPRTGTTKLQRMLSAAPDVQQLYLWRMLNPAPLAGAVAGQPDPRIAAMKAGGGVGSEDMEANATVNAGHEMTAMQVDEDVFLFDFTLDQSITGVGAYAPYFQFDEWAAGTPERTADVRAYRYVRTLLQYLQWQDGGRRDRPWILKFVPHLAHLDALLECYPDATIVHTHRDPRTAVPSIAKVMFNLYSMTAEVDQAWIGAAMLEWCSNMMNRCLDARDRLKLDDRILDIRYEDVRTGAMTVMRKVHEHAGRQLTPAAARAMAAWEEANEQGKFGKHSYTLEEFALDKSQLTEAFAEYTGRFSALF